MYELDEDLKPVKHYYLASEEQVCKMHLFKRENNCNLSQQYFWKSAWNRTKIQVIHQVNLFVIMNYFLYKFFLNAFKVKAAMDKVAAQGKAKPT